MSEVTQQERAPRLLIVEDDQAQLRTLTAIMQDEGFEVISCSTASAALEHVGRDDVGVAVLDLRLPDLSGTELLEKLRERDSRLNVVINTAYASLDSARDAVNLGAFAYVEKAGDPEELIRHVYRAFRARLVRYTHDLEDAVAERTRDLQTANQMLRREITDRKRTEEALQYEQQLLQILMDSVPDTIYFKDRESRFTRINRAQAHMLGLEHPDQAVGKHDREFFPRELADQYHADEQRVIMTGEPLIGSIEAVTRADGERRWLSTTKVPIRDASGGIVGTVGVSRDITERRRAEEALRESEERYRKLAETAQDYIYIIDADDRVEFVNTAGAAAMGCRPEEIIGKPRGEVFCGAESERQLRSLRRVFETGEPLSTVEPASLPTSQSWQDTRLTPIKNESGAVRAVLGISRDVTALKRVEQALRESDARYRALFEQAGDGIVLVDARTGALADFNAQAYRNLGYTRDEFRKLKIADFEASESAEEVARHIAQVVRGGADTFETRHRTKSGEIRNVLVASRAISLGGCDFTLSIFRDITERREAEERSREHLAELTHVARLSTMGEMATGLAHELNQPLSAILNYAEGARLGVQSGKRKPQELGDDLQAIAAEAQRAGEIIRRLRSFVRKRQPRRSSLDVNELIRDTLRFAESETRINDIRLRVELAAGLPKVLADPTLVQQVVLNLVRNGIDALGHEPAGQRDLTISTALVGGDAVEVAVCDNGRGLPGHSPDELFTPFFTTKPEGLGLGLSISRSIIEAEGGRLTGSANPERGMTFRFTLPACTGDSDHGV
jgi:two-component system sensor kinase FixL